MEELTYKDLSGNELDTLKDMYISSRVDSMTESDLRKFVKEIIALGGDIKKFTTKSTVKALKDKYA